MNTFQKRSLTKHWIKSHIVLSLLALSLGFFTLRGVVGAIAVGKPFSVKQIFISAIGDSIQTDEYGHTNILLIGVGGEGHDGENLTDTMIVASLNRKDNVVSMISIPRDLYVENEEVGWGTRINSIYEYILDETDDPTYAMDELQSEIEKVLDVSIHYYAKVDFRGFEEAVDALGGITVDVKEAITDLAYPAPTGSDQFYEAFYLNPGIQNLDGETALKYVRSRHNTSDFDRAERQQEVIKAIQEKALSLGVLANPVKIKDLYRAVSRHFESDLTLSEMLTLVGFGSDLTSDSIFNTVLNDDATVMGGFLYTPPRDEGDPYYLVPYSGDFLEIQTFAQLFLYHTEIVRDAVPLEVLNGTREASLAGLTKMMLTRYGFNVLTYGNGSTKDLKDTRLIALEYRYRDDDKESVMNTLELLPSLTFGEIVKSVPDVYASSVWPGSAYIIIELGDDFAEYYREHDELFYIGIY